MRYSIVIIISSRCDVIIKVCHRNHLVRQSYCFTSCCFNVTVILTVIRDKAECIIYRDGRGVCGHHTSIAAYSKKYESIVHFLIKAWNSAHILYTSWKLFWAIVILTFGDLLSQFYMHKVSFQPVCPLNFTRNYLVWVLN